MKSIQRFLIAILIVTGFAGATFAQRGPGDKGPGSGGPGNGPGKHERGNPAQFHLSDSCWKVFLSQLPADSAEMLTRALECLKNNHTEFNALWAELRAAHKAKDSAKVAELRGKLELLRTQRRECDKVVKTILGQYRHLLNRVRKECEGSPRRDSIGHKGPRDTTGGKGPKGPPDSTDHKGPHNVIDVKVGAITPNPVPTGQATAELAFGVRIDTKVVITISDQLGNILKEVFNGDLTAGAHTQSLDLSGLPAGMYYVRVQAGSGVGTARLVIQ